MVGSLDWQQPRHVELTNRVGLRTQGYREEPREVILMGFGRTTIRSTKSGTRYADICRAIEAWLKDNA
jgi:hypothetical protein